MIDELYLARYPLNSDSRYTFYHLFQKPFKGDQDTRTFYSLRFIRFSGNVTFWMGHSV